MGIGRLSLLAIGIVIAVAAIHSAITSGIGYQAFMSSAYAAICLIIALSKRTSDSGWRWRFSRSGGGYVAILVLGGLGCALTSAVAKSSLSSDPATHIFVLVTALVCMATARADWKLWLRLGYIVVAPVASIGLYIVTVPVAVAFVETFGYGDIWFLTTFLTAYPLVLYLLRQSALFVSPKMLNL